MNQHSSQDAALSRPAPPHPPRPRRLTPNGIVWPIAVVATLLMAVWEFPAELARWYRAAAEVHLDHNRLDPALASLQQAMDWDADEPRNYTTRALVHVEAKRFDQALADCAEAIRLRPDELNGYRTRVAVLMEMKQFERAIRDCDTMVQLRPDDVTVYFTRVKVRSEMRQFDRTLGDSDKVVRYYEQHRGPFANMTEWDAYNYRAYQRALAGAELDGGMEDIETALAALRGEKPINPRNVERALGRQLEMANLLDTRALLYYHKKEYEKGLADMQEAIPAAQQWLNFKSASRNWPDQSTKDATLREYRRILAVMYKHQMLLHEGMSQELLAEMDRQRIVQLGFDPEANLY